VVIILQIGLGDLCRQNYFGKISGQTEVENYTSPMPRLGVVTSQGLVAGRYTQILARQDYISSRVALDSI
jgi:hypothetical protein